MPLSLLTTADLEAVTLFEVSTSTLFSTPSEKWIFLASSAMEPSNESVKTRLLAALRCEKLESEVLRLT